jgi:branched-chain amino acid aminotransferase
MEFSHFSRNGELRPIEEAVVPLSSLEYQYGFGVYESIRVRSGVPYFLAQHIARLMESARLIGLTHDFTPAAVARAVGELVAHYPTDTYNLKILLIGGEPQLFILPLAPHFPDKKLYRDGVHTVAVRYERLFPHAKSLNMLGSYLAYTKAKAAGAYDALLLDAGGRLLEGTRTNFFCMKGKALYSAPEDTILLGVTRTIVLKVARELGLETHDATIRPEDLGSYDAAFLTSTSAGIMPIASVDDFHFPPQPDVLHELMRAFDTFVSGSGGVL